MGEMTWVLVLVSLNNKQGPWTSPMTVTVSHTLNESLGEVTVFEPGHPSEELPGLHVHACAHLRFIPKPSIRISKVGLRESYF